MVGLVEGILAGDGGERERLAALAEAEPDARGPDGTPALLLAHYRGMTDVVEAIRRSRPLDLREAAAVGDVATVAARLRSGEGGIDERTPDGFTALQLAAHFDHVTAAALLVRHGADVGARATGTIRVQPLHAAAAAPTAACVPLLIAAGAPVDDPQDAGFTALHEVALRGREDLVELLLAAGADPGITDDAGRDAAAHAEAAGHVALAARLREATSAA